MIKYDPNDAVLCWPEGEYRATLETVEEKTSKADVDLAAKRYRDLVKELGQ